MPDGVQSALPRDPVIASENLAAECTNGRSLCYTVAQISTTMQRQFCCERAQQKITTSGVGSLQPFSARCTDGWFLKS